MNNKSINQRQLQRQNFKEILLGMKSIAGWEIFEEGDLLALKAPSSVNFVNFVWGNSSKENIANIRCFYGNKQFTWLTNIGDNKDNLLEAGFTNEGSDFAEMFLNFDKHTNHLSLSNINVITPQTNSELDIWADTASRTFGCSVQEFKEFFVPLVNFGQCTPFLVMYDSNPAGTAMVYCGKDIAGIYSMSTLERYRRKGVAMAGLNACISLAKNRGLNYAVLHSSELGEQLYRKAGFDEVFRLQEWCLN